MKLFLITFFSVATICAQPISQSPVWLLSYPRSGNTWTRYCIEYLTKRPTGEYQYLFSLDQRTKYINNNDPKNCFISNIEIYDNWKPENRLLIYYEQLSLEEKIWIDDLCRESNPNLFDHYLSRYTEKPDQML